MFDKEKQYMPSRNEFDQLKALTIFIEDTNAQYGWHFNAAIQNVWKQRE